MEISVLCTQFCEYATTIRGYSKATIRRYKYVIGCFCRFTGTQDISQVNLAKMRELFYYGRTERKWAPRTFIVYYMTLEVFFRWCKKQGYLSVNPLCDIEIPKIEKKLPVRLTKQDALRLLDIVYNYPHGNAFLRCRNHAIFAMFIFAGLRKQELLNLHFADVDTDNMTIFVRQGKGSKDRIIPMPYALRQSLTRYVTERKKLNKTCPQFFASFNRNVGYTDNGLKRLVREMSGALGIRFSVHKLRHTFATLMLEGGCDIYSLSKMLGHSDIKTTTIYLSATVEHLRVQMAKHPMGNFIENYNNKTNATDFF